MRRKHPRILGSLRNPLPPQAPQPSVNPASIRLFPSQPSTPQPAFHTNSLSVFYPTSFPPLKNTAYFPTFMITLPSSSCVDKLSSKHPALFEPSSYLSTLMTTSPKSSPLESCLVSLSHQEAGYPQSDWHILRELKNSPNTDPGIGGDRWNPTPLVPEKQHPETQTRNYEVEDTQVLLKLGDFTHLSCLWSNNGFGIEKRKGKIKAFPISKSGNSDPHTTSPFTDDAHLVCRCA
ncbi:1700129C05Rik [Phodopus roborovskii]|uniref:1700129C05Rik protein n=1 Tax=Phodopus roborovskii TaxID=109678 RepID=A0AAU9ZRS0_PHORO|nr:1700129C05Rik [Phodopus roborovskii]